MYTLKAALSQILEDINSQGLYKKERIISTPQAVEIEALPGGEVLNFCANNYLGLCNNPRIVKAS